ncbi:unnamed protein product [[Candida] boidinii]|nr:unnamed protein product [[Candida] boidinii]GMF90978.1 unnamed protein product [[Candida] boidinii]
MDDETTTEEATDEETANEEITEEDTSDDEISVDEEEEAKEDELSLEAEVEDDVVKNLVKILYLPAGIAELSLNAAKVRLESEENLTAYSIGKGVVEL